MVSENDPIVIDRNGFHNNILTGPPLIPTFNDGIPIFTSDEDTRPTQEIFISGSWDDWSSKTPLLNGTVKLFLQPGITFTSISLMENGK